MADAYKYFDDLDYNDHSDYVVKFVLIGEAGSGKSSIMAKFIEDVFSSDYVGTIEKVHSSCRDTAGDERFRGIIQSYFRGAAAIMIVLDVTNKKSYSNLSEWMEQVKQFGSDKYEVLLVANKCDLEEERCVTEQQCQKFAIQHDLEVMYVSAKTGENIDEAFQTLAKRVLKIDQDVPPVEQ